MFQRRLIVIILKFYNKLNYKARDEYSEDINMKLKNTKETIKQKGAKGLKRKQQKNNYQQIDEYNQNFCIECNLA